MTTTTATATATDAVLIAEAFLDTDKGRKATDDDMRATTVEAMTSWVLDYRGDFPFLREMTRAAFQSRQYGRDLRPGQARGVLNCLLAQVKRERQDGQPAAQPIAVAGTRPVVDGYYTVVMGAGHVTLRLRTAKSGKYQHVAVLGAANQYTAIGGLYDGTSFRFWQSTTTAGDSSPLVPSQWTRQRQALDVLLQSDDAARVAAGKAFALASGTCFRCAALLTDPLSIGLGLGPDCKKHFGY